MFTASAVQARAATTCFAVTLINPDDQHKFQRIEKLIGKVVEKGLIPASLGEGPEYGMNSKRDAGRSGNRQKVKNLDQKGSKNKPQPRQHQARNSSSSPKQANVVTQASVNQDPRPKISIIKQGAKPA